MKRPRWFSGRAASEEEDGGEGRPDREPAGTAERSAKRGAAAGKRPDSATESSKAARRTLGARVGGAAGGRPAAGSRKRGKPDPETDEEARKPKSAGKPGARPPSRKPGDEPERKPAGGRGGKRVPGRKGDAARKSDDEGKRELHRPRRQRDDDRSDRRRDAKGGGKRRDRARPAKRATRSVRARAGAAAISSAGAFRRGAVESRRRVASAAPKVGRRILALIGAMFSVFFLVLGLVLNVLIAVGSFFARPTRYVLSRIGRVTSAASRVLSPTRVLAIVVAGAAILLALSQYADYRLLAIGNDAYSGVQNVAPPPETGRLPTGDAHSYAFVPISIACLLLLAGALTGRWRLCRLIAIAGAAAIVVAIVVDRPAGLDPGTPHWPSTRVRATLLGGFYAQIAAGVLLVGSSSLLARELRLAVASEPAGSVRGRARHGRRRRLRRPPGAEGARA